MDSFEGLIATIAAFKGYWVQPGLKVNLTKPEKRAIGRPSSPRWELDVVAYKGQSNEVLVVECKSYLDSLGIKAEDVINPEARYATRYKLFTDSVLRRVVFSRLSVQLQETGLCRNDPKLRLCLAAGKIATQKDRALLADHFENEGWWLWDEDWIRSHLEEMSQSGYQDEPSVITAKLLLRGQNRGSPKVG